VVTNNFIFKYRVTSENHWLLLYYFFTFIAKSNYLLWLELEHSINRHINVVFRLKQLVQKDQVKYTIILNLLHVEFIVFIDNNKFFERSFLFNNRLARELSRLR